MLNKEVSEKFGFSIFLVVLAVALFSIVSIGAQSVGQTGQGAEVEQFVCAERTISGAWCQNVPQSEADTSIGPDGNPYRVAQTSCDATAFCKTGTCVDSFDGLCQGNTPQRVCENSGGVWDPRESSEITQCKLGCCFIGDEASFVTQTRCSARSSDYGVETDFDGRIRTEAQCLASASPKEKGACVVDDGFTRGCKLTTRAECQSTQSPSEGSVEFHGGFLCSAESLGTVCGPSTQTMLVKGRDEVYFKDNCGNQANVYDASKVDEQEYWTKIIKPEESCELIYDSGGNPRNSATCGNCQYLDGGSVGKQYSRGNLVTPVKPQQGDFVCAALGCEWEGQTYKHGESWCETTASTEQRVNNPGAESGRLLCQFGEVTVESCSLSSEAGRAKVCVEEEVVEGFSTAACRANRWQDCVVQENKRECENTEQRDCKWVEGVSLLGEAGFVSEGTIPYVVNQIGELVQEVSGVQKGASCVPKNAPGFKFWEEEGQAQELCVAASQNCVVKFQKGVLPGSDYECKENCECIGLIKGAKRPSDSDVRAWANARNNMCVQIGDCGSFPNYVGEQGYNSLEDLYDLRRSISPEDE